MLLAVTDEGSLQLLDSADLGPQGSGSSTCWPLDAAATRLVHHAPDNLLAVLCSHQACSAGWLLRVVQLLGEGQMSGTLSWPLNEVPAALAPDSASSSSLRTVSSLCHHHSTRLRMPASSQSDCILWLLLFCCPCRLLDLSTPAPCCRLAVSAPQSTPPAHMRSRHNCSVAWSKVP